MHQRKNCQSKIQYESEEKFGNLNRSLKKFDTHFFGGGSTRMPVYGVGVIT